MKRILLPTTPEHSSQLNELEESLFGSSSAKEEVTVQDFGLEFALQGQEAIEKVQKSIDESNPFSLAFIDVRMPPGIDGVQACRQIFEIDPKIQIVICSAFSDYSWTDMQRELGERENLLFISKPFNSVSVRQFALSLTRKWFLDLKNREHVDQLEQRVEERTQELRTSQQAVENILHHIKEGLFTVDLNLLLDAEHSLASEEIFNRKDFKGIHICDFLDLEGHERKDFELWFELITRPERFNQWRQLVLLCPINKFQRSQEEETHHYSLDCAPMLKDGQLEKVLFTISDITEVVESEKNAQKEKVQKERLLEHTQALIAISPKQRHSFFKRLESLQSFLIESLNPQKKDRFEGFRLLHTARGDAAMLGFLRLANQLLDCEDLWHDDKSKSDIEIWQKKWDDINQLVMAEIKSIRFIHHQIFDRGHDDALFIDPKRFNEIIQKVESGNLSSIDLSAQLRQLLSSPLDILLQPYQRQIKEAALKRSIPLDMIKASDDSIPVPREMISKIEPLLTHLLRNALDHGLENKETREKQGKGLAKIEVSFKQKNDSYVLEVSDNGRGLQLESIANKALEKGIIEEAQLPNLNNADITKLIFLPDFSTRSKVGDWSGRGVGLNAVSSYVKRLDGNLEVDFSPNQFTLFRVTLPHTAVKEDTPEMN